MSHELRDDILEHYLSAYPNVNLTPGWYGQKIQTVQKILKLTDI